MGNGLGRWRGGGRLAGRGGRLFDVGGRAGQGRQQGAQGAGGGGGQFLLQERFEFPVAGGDIGQPSQPGVDAHETGIGVFVERVATAQALVALLRVIPSLGLFMALTKPLQGVEKTFVIMGLQRQEPVVMLIGQQVGCRRKQVAGVEGDGFLKGVILHPLVKLIKAPKIDHQIGRRGQPQGAAFRHDPRLADDLLQAVQHIGKVAPTPL